MISQATNKPSILAVIRQHVELRKSGKEYIGHCPFHEDKTPSLSVSADKGLFHCFGCGESGDVFDFIKKLEGVGFREAKARLGVTNQYDLRPPILTTKQRQAAELAAAWMTEQRRKINVLLAESLEKIELADEVGDSELAERFLREQSFLRDLYDDLDISRNAASLLAARPSIEALTEDVELWL